MPSFAKCLVYLLSFHPHNNSRSQDIVKPRILLTLFYVETSKAQSQICADWFLNLYLQLLSELGHLHPVCGQPEHQLSKPSQIQEIAADLQVTAHPSLHLLTRPSSLELSERPPRPSQ